MTHLTLGEQAVSQTAFQIAHTVINISTYHCRFCKWQKPISFDTYGGKAILELNNEPLFAELYVLRLLEKQGFIGVWVDTYRGKFWAKHPSFSQPIVELPSILRQAYNAIKLQNGNLRKGCWDVLAYRDTEILCVELKRMNKDSIRQSQIDWLYAAINVGLQSSNFVIVEWDFA